MNLSVAVRVASRRGLPNTDFTEKCASSRPVRTAARNVRMWTWNSSASWASGSSSVCRAWSEIAAWARWSIAAGIGRRPLSHVRKCLDRYSEQRGELSLAKTGRSAQIAKLVHAGHRMPSVDPDVKRPPAFMPGDHDDFSAWCADRANCESRESFGKSRGVDSPSSGANSQDRSLCSICVRREIFLSIEIGEFFRNWRARRDSNAGPPA